MTDPDTAPAPLPDDAHTRAILAVINSPDWTAAEKWVVKWQYQHSLKFLGHFEAALAEAIMRADEDNLAKLHRGFPDQVEGFMAWSRGDLAKRLRAAGATD